MVLFQYGQILAKLSEPKMCPNTACKKGFTDSQEMLQLALIEGENYSLHYFGFALATFFVAALSNHFMVSNHDSINELCVMDCVLQARQNFQFLMDEYDLPILGGFFRRYGHFCFLELAILALMCVLVFLPVVVQPAKLNHGEELSRSFSIFPDPGFIAVCVSGFVISACVGQYVSGRRIRANF